MNQLHQALEALKRGRRALKNSQLGSGVAKGIEAIDQALAALSSQPDTVPREVVSREVIEQAFIAGHQKITRNYVTGLAYRTEKANASGLDAIYALQLPSPQDKRERDEAVSLLLGLVKIFDAMGLVGIDDPKDSESCHGQVELAKARVFLARIEQCDREVKRG